jgi:heat shock protein HslJ
MSRMPASLLGRWRVRPLALAAFFLTGLAAADAADFPYDTEMMLDARPMRGSKRIPLIEVRPNGEASIDLWCSSLKTQFVIAADTVTIMSGQKTEQQCTPDRMRADEELLAALLGVTNWRRQGDTLTLVGDKTLRFRASAH